MICHGNSIPEALFIDKAIAPIPCKAGLKGFYASPIDDIIDLKLKKANVILQLKGLLHQSLSILELPDNWDEEGACSYKKDTLDKAHEFLKKLFSLSAQSAPFKLPFPRILPGPNGSIDIYWKTSKYEILINIPNDTTQEVSFYADNYCDSNIKGKFTYITAQECILSWLRNL